MDFSGLPDDTLSSGLDLSGLPDNNAKTLREQYRTTTGTPDEAAKVFDLSARTGVPKPVVERNKPHVERQANEPDWDALEVSAPVTVRELAANAKMFELANDDTENLREIERTFNRRSEGKIGGAPFVQSPDRMGPSQGPTPSFSSTAYGLYNSFIQGSERARQGVRLQAADAFGFDEMFADALRKRDQAQFRQDITTPAFESATARGIYGGGASTLQNLPGIAASILTRSPTPALAAAGVQTELDAYGKYRSRGATPGQALIGAVGEGAVEVATEMIPMRTMLGAFGQPGKTAAKEFLKSQVQEQFGEQAATILQDAIDTAVANPDKTWGEYLKERPDAAYQTFLATLVQSGVMTAGHTALSKLAGDEAKAQGAAKDAEAIAQISQLAAASKLRARDPQTFNDFVTAANEDGPVQDIYIDARTLQQVGIDPVLLAQASPSVAAQLEEALATGGDLIIPMAEYATKIAGTELDPVLTPHLRTSEEALSLDEAQRFYQGQTEEFKKAAARVMEEKQTDTAWQQSAKVVEAKLFEQLQNTGRFTSDVNTAYSTIMRDFYVTTAARLGITPTEMFDRYPLRVATERMAGGARMEQVTPIQALQTNVRMEMPSDPLFAEAVSNTPGAQVTENGLLIDLVRYQKPEQEGAQAIRTGVFYLPTGAATAKHYKTGKTGYGGTEKFQGQTLLRRPLFVKGATGGKAPEVAYDLLKGKKAYEAMRADVLKVAVGWGKTEQQKVEGVRAVLSQYDADPALASEIVRNSREGNTLPYAVQENIVAHAVRAAGHDAVVGYSKGKTGANISEVFDVREQTFPARGVESQVHDSFLQKVFQTVAQALGLQAPTQEQPAAVEPTPGEPLGMGQFFNQDQEGNRGEIAFGKDITQTPSVITLFKNADLSTLLHEMGHFQLEVLANIAARPDAPVEITQDMDAVLKWFGVADLATWRTLSLEEKRPYHEQFARGFEAYLFEGRAPNTELNGVFARFRAWLINVYKSIQALNVEISDDIRGVFDRLVATEEAIKQAEEARSYGALFKNAEEMGDAELYAEYQRNGAEATQTALDGLQRKSLRDMQWLTNARSRILKQMQKDAAEKRKAVEAEVRAEVRAMPVYTAINFLKKGEMVAPDGEMVKVEKGYRLDTAALAEMYPESMLARPALERLQGMTRKDGLHPDLVAQMFGFTSGDHLVREIIAAAPEAEMIEGMTDQRVLERYGDLANPDTLARATDEAIHNEARARFVATELKALSKATGPVRVLAKAAKDFATTTLARKKVREIKPNQYAAAETRAAKAAEKALKAGDTALAATEKRNQLVQNYGTRLAYDALDEIDRAVKYVKKFDNEATRKAIDISYREQIDAMRERFDFRSGQTLTAIDKRASLAEWITSQEEMGFEPTISEELRNEAFRKHYKDLTLEELRGVVDAIKNIEHLGRLKKKLLTAAEDREFDAAVQEIVGSIQDNAKGSIPPQRSSERSLVVRVKALFRYAAAIHRKFASLVREFDGFKDGGSAWEYLVRNMNDRGNFEAVETEKATRHLTELLKPIMQLKLREKQYFPSIGRSFSREERIGIALNMGNEVNVERVMTGERLSPTQLAEVLNTLSKEETDFVQAIWDYFETFRPQLAEKERRLTGIEPKWVVPTPWVTQHGTYKGGYYPIAYDPLLDDRASADINAEVQKQLERGLYVRAQTARGHLKARTESTGRPLRYDFGEVISRHITQVVHDLAWHEYLIDANRLLRDKNVQAAIREHYGPEVYTELKDTLKDIAIGAAGTEKGAKFFDHLRYGVTIAGLGFNIFNTLQNLTGITQSFSRVGTGWVLKGAAHWAGDAAHMESSIQKIHEKSDFMRLRAKTMLREINEIRNKVSGNDSKLQAAYFWLQSKTQLMVDVPTWWGAYEKAMSESDMTEAKAIALADQAVIDAQGSGQIKDLAGVQRGGSGLKLFTTFYSFFNTTFNNTAEAYGRTDFKKPKDVAMFAADMALLYTIPALLSTLLKAALQGDWDDEEKLARKLVGDQISYMMGTVVGVREMAAGVQAATGSGEGFGYTGPASVRFFADFYNLGKQVQQGEADEAFWKSLNNEAGILFHYPAGQINRTASGIAALSDGRTENPMALLMGAPKK